MLIAPGSTDQSIYMKLVDSTAGTPETGLTIANLSACYVRDGADHSASTALTALATVTTAHTDNYAIEIDSTACPGLYRIDYPDAAFAAGVARVQLIVTGAAIDPAVIEVELVPWLTPITGATVRAVNAADAALSTYAGGAVASVTAGVNVTAIGGQAASAAAPVTFPAAVGTSTYAGGAAVPGDAMTLTGAYDAAKTAAQASTALTNAMWTDARAAKLDFLTGAVATAAKLLSLVQSLARKDVTVDADIGGTYDDATDSLQAIRDRGDAAWLSSAGGSGSVSWTYTLTSSVAPNPPIANAEVWVTTDLAGTNTVASGTTNALGVVTFQLDPGTYYVWRALAGWDFTNPDTEVVV